MKTGNKGEWSELYVFLKLLADGKLFPGDDNLNIRSSHYYPIIEILRKEVGIDKKYSISGTNIIINQPGPAQISIPSTSFQSEARHLLNHIKASSGTFSAPLAEAFLISIGGSQIKADSSSKADILVQIHDFRTNLQPVLGFSIKSKLGSPSTLLNAGHTTNFIFKIVGNTLTSADISNLNAINSKNKIRDRIRFIQSRGCDLVLSDLENKVFKNNLVLIDSSLIEILGNALKISNQLGITNLSAITANLEANNPLNFDQSNMHKFYEHKMKRFLSDVALGMMPKAVWNGVYKGTEGYIIVKTDGELVCYHIIERNLFEQYLLTNTKLETGSSSKHGFGSVYKIGNDDFINLNLQIRFI